MTLGVDSPDTDGMMTIGTLGVFVWSDDRYGADVAGTMAFTTFVLFQMTNVFNARRKSGSVLSRYSLTNNKLWSAVGVVVAFQALAVRWGPLQSVFDTVTLDLGLDGQSPPSGRLPDPTPSMFSCQRPILRIHRSRRRWLIG